MHIVVLGALGMKSRTRHYTQLFMAVGVGLTIGAFQACSKATFTNNKASANSTASAASYTCVSGKELGVWLDPDNSGVIRAQNYLGSVVSYQGPLSAADNYDYYSASAHPVVGPTPIGYEANVFFYEGPDGLAITFFANIDAGGSSNNIFNVDLSISGNQNKDSVLLSDDKNELQQVSAGQYQGRFHYWYNTDGGVIGPLVGQNYKILVHFDQTGDIKTARFYSADGQSFTLGNNSQNISSFIIAYQKYQNCN